MAAAGYATEFGEIPLAVWRNAALRERILALVRTEPIREKALADEARLRAFREILASFFAGAVGFNDTIVDTQAALSGEPPADVGRGWAEGLVRSQVSRFYNQAVLAEQLERGATEVYVPHSEAERWDAPCTRLLAGQAHDAQLLYDLLMQAYHHGNLASREARVPNHPQCTHVVAPVG